MMRKAVALVAVKIVLIKREGW